MASAQEKRSPSESHGSLRRELSVHGSHVALEISKQSTPRQSAELGANAAAGNDDAGQGIESETRRQAVRGDDGATAVPKVQKSGGDDVNDAVRNAKAEEGWKKCIQRMREADDRMVEGWNDEIETLLIFAGLFSAVVTTFVVQSYPTLQQGDQSALILLHISHQLSSLSAGVQNTTSSAPFIAHSFRANSSTVAINTLWLISLGLSLIVAIFCLFARQWLRHYNDWQKFSPRQSALLRQARFKKLHAGQIPLIMNLLPLTLQVALAFFLAGLVILLWGINHVVAIHISALCAFLAIAIMIVTIVPVIQDFSPFKSSLSWMVFQAAVAALGLCVEAIIFVAWLTRRIWSAEQCSLHEFRLKARQEMRDWYRNEWLWHTSWAHIDLQSFPKPNSDACKDLEAAVLEWIDVYVFDTFEVNDLISACTWGMDLRGLIRVVSASKREDQSAYGDALMQAIELKSHCDCPLPIHRLSSDEKDSDCGHITLRQLMKLIINLPQGWLAVHEDRQRYCDFLYQNLDALSCAVLPKELLGELGWAVSVLQLDITENLKKLDHWLRFFDQISASGVTIDYFLLQSLAYISADLLRLLSQIQQEELSTKHRSGLMRFWSQQRNLVNDLNGAERWPDLGRWPNEILELSSKSPKHFNGDIASLLASINLPKTSDEADIAAHKLFVQAGNTLNGYFSENASPHDHLDLHELEPPLELVPIQAKQYNLASERESRLSDQVQDVHLDITEDHPTTTLLPILVHNDESPGAFISLTQHMQRSSASEPANPTIEVVLPRDTDGLSLFITQKEGESVASAPGETVGIGVVDARLQQIVQAGVSISQDSTPPDAGGSSGGANQLEG